MSKQEPTLPESYTLPAAAYDLLFSYTKWYEDMPEAVGEGAGERFHENMDDLKYETFMENVMEELPDFEEAGYYIADFETGEDGKLYALLQDNDNEWEDAKRVLIHRIEE